MKLCILLHPMLPRTPIRSANTCWAHRRLYVRHDARVARMCYDGMFKDFPDIVG
jgi:hypothetical protein